MKLRKRGLLWATAVAAGLIALALWVSAIFFPEGLLGAALVAADSPGATLYSNGYSAIGFWRVRAGMSRADVNRLLGQPIEESWVYQIRDSDGLESSVNLAGGRVRSVMVLDQRDAILQAVRVGMTETDVVRELGAPAKVKLFFTARSGKQSYEERKVFLEHGIVTHKEASVYLD